MNGEAASGSVRDTPLPRSRGSSGEAGEGVFQKAQKHFGAHSGHQAASFIVLGRFDGSSPLRAAPRQISFGNLDLMRPIAHQQSKLAFGAGKACT